MDSVVGDTPDKEAKKAMYDRMSEPKSQDELEVEVLDKFTDRLADMDSARKEIEADWDVCDGQMEANTFYDENGTLQVNVPLEQDLVETACGRFSGKLNFKLEPVWHQGIVEDQQAAKHSLAHYIRAEKMHKEISLLRRDKATYGTGIYFTGIVGEVTKTVEFKEGAEVDCANALRNNDNYNEVTEENYYFTGYNVPLRAFWIDDKALNKKWHDSKQHEAEDAIMKRTMSIDKFKETYGENKYFINIDQVGEQADPNPDYGEQKRWLNDEVILYEYFNVVTKDYWIIANESIVIYIGKMLNKSGKLPFGVGQHYTNTKSFYGRGICHKVRYLKAYKAEMLQDMLDQSRMWGLSLITGNNGEVDGHYFNDPSEVNIINYTAGVEQIKPLQFQPDLNKYQSILTILDDLSIQDTGENIKATYQPVAEQLGTVEIIENNRMARVATVDENDDNLLCDILTEVLSSISQFAPSLQKKIIKTKEWGVEREIYPYIKVPNSKVEQDGTKINIMQDEWEEWYFEFREKMITSKYYVKVITNSNINVMNTLEKNSITQYVQNLQIVAQFNPEAIQQEDWKWLLDLMKQLYGYDEKFVAETKRDKIKAENIEMMWMLQTLLWLTDPNAQIQEDPNNPSSTIPGGQEQQGGVPWSPQPQGWVPTAGGGLPSFGETARWATI